MTAFQASCHKSRNRRGCLWALGPAILAGCRSAPVENPPSARHSGTFDFAGHGHEAMPEKGHRCFTFLFGNS